MSKVLIDTNVILRFLIADNQSLHEKAKDFFKKVEEGELKAVVSILVINEYLWICKGYYHLSREEFVQPFAKLLQLPDLSIQEVEKSVLLKVLDMYRTSTIDFTDLYLAYLSSEKLKVATFDKDLTKIQSTVFVW